MRRNAVQLAVCLVLAGAIAAGAAVVDSAAQDGSTVLLAYPGSPDGRWSRLADGLAADLSREGVTVKRLPLSAMGGSRHALTALRAGRIDVTVISGMRLAAEVAAVGVLNLPFLAVNVEEARRIVAAVGPDLEAAAAAKGLRVLGYTWVAGTFVSSGGCVLTPEDVKGAKVMDGPPQHQVLMRLAGANPVPMPGADVLAALQAGIAETGLFPIEFILDGGFSKVTDCITDPSRAAAMLFPLVIVSTPERMASLTPGTVKVLEDAIDGLEKAADAGVSEAIAGAVKSYASEGKAVKPMDGKALGIWRDLARPLQDEFAEKVDGGGKLLERARDAR